MEHPSEQGVTTTGPGRAVFAPSTTPTTMKETRINVIVDYRGKFFPATKYWDASLDLAKLTAYFAQSGLRTRFWTYFDASNNLRALSGEVVMYQSSEDRGGWYKSYIEDVLLALQLIGAILVPAFPMLRAHHNKSFMELLRKALGDRSIDLPAHVFGTYEDYLGRLEIVKNGKWVLKPAAGACSKGVALLATPSDKLALPRKISLVGDWKDILRIWVKHFLRFRYKDYRKKSYRRKKFVVQRFIENLKGDFKVLIFGDKLYLLARSNRKNDFRASGSGLFNSDPAVPDGLLDYCWSVFQIFDVPIISMDVAHLDGRFFLIEFQFVCFGMYTLEKSSFYYTKTPQGWSKVEATPDVEREFVSSVCLFLRKKHILESC